MILEQFRQRKLEVLVFVDYYLPGYKAGGPIKTISNLVDRLGDEFCFRIVTRDRDFDDGKPYYNDTGNWRSVGKAEVRYVPPEQCSYTFMRKILTETHYDIVYFNSLFSPCFTIFPLISHNLSSKRKIPVILAPRGEVADSALGLKSYKKTPFLKLAKMLKLFDNIKWHASSPYEAENVHRLFDTHKNIAKVKFVPNVVIAPDLPESPSHELQNVPDGARWKKHNNLKIVFLARIARMKNLDGALKLLQGVHGNIQFDIYGPLEDRAYWAECEDLIRMLPPNIEVQYKGHIKREDVLTVLKKYHIFFLPTLGENFGHVILEALSAGCPVLISDRTPWRGLEDKGVGWDIPLEEPERFQTVLRQCVEMDCESLKVLSSQAIDFAHVVAIDENVVELSRSLFLEAMT